MPQVKNAPISKKAPDKRAVPVEEETDVVSSQKIDTEPTQRKDQVSAPGDLSNITSTQQSGVSPGGRQNAPIGAGVSTGGGTTP